MAFKIFLSPPHMEGNELKYVEEVFHSNYIAPVGEYIDKFEKEICRYTGAKYCVALSSGTSAIHLALKVLGIKEGDYVITSTFTFIGSVSPIIYEKAIPVFIDSDTKSWNMDPHLLEQSIKKLIKKNKKPKALIVVHLYGQPADIENIKTICDKYNIYIIEDAAESLGAKFNNKHTGTFGILGVFSFNGNKIITTSGGGALISNNKNLIDKARFLSTQAKENTLWYEHKEIGYNYRMSNVLAAIGVGQMEVLEKKVKKKREIFKKYVQRLSNMDIDFMPELSSAFGSRWLTTAILKNENPMDLINYLASNGIESRPLWKPMHLQPALKKFPAFTTNTSENIFLKGICLPSGTSLSCEDIEFISNLIIKKLKKY